MSDNAEGGIAAVQAKAVHTNGLQKHHKSTIGYLNERVVGYVFMIAFVGLMVVWMTASSGYITYGSLAAFVLIAALWGVLQIKRIHQIRE